MEVVFTKGRGIVENKVRCRVCKTVLISTDQYKTEYCRCGTIWISGGTKKTLRGGEIFFIEELSTMKEV
jgi:hypothetical protein